MFSRGFQPKPSIYHWNTGFGSPMSNVYPKGFLSRSNCNIYIYDTINWVTSICIPKRYMYCIYIYIICIHIVIVVHPDPPSSVLPHLELRSSWSTLGPVLGTFALRSWSRRSKTPRQPKRLVRKDSERPVPPRLGIKAGEQPFRFGKGWEERLGKIINK